MDKKKQHNAQLARNSPLFVGLIHVLAGASLILVDLFRALRGLLAQEHLRWLAFGCVVHCQVVARELEINNVAQILAGWLNDKNVNTVVSFRPA